MKDDSFFNYEDRIPPETGSGHVTQTFQFLLNFKIDPIVIPLLQGLIWFVKFT